MSTKNLIDQGDIFENRNHRRGLENGKIPADQGERGIGRSGSAEDFRCLRSLPPRAAPTANTTGTLGRQISLALSDR
jgi:hypothetical protein